MAERKTCSTCKRDLPLSEFSPRKTGKYGVTSQCRNCRCLIERERRYAKTGIAFGEYIRSRPISEFMLCTKCGQTLSRDSFYENRPGYYCKKCIQASNSAYRAKCALVPKVSTLKQKVCTKCGLEKPVEAYNKSKYASSGLQSACKECCRLSHIKYYKANSAKIYERNAEWRERNADWYLEDRRQYNKKWYKANKERYGWKFRLKNNKRRSAVTQGDVPEWAWLALLDLCGHVCVKCGSADRLTIDHIIPLSKGGAHDISNVQPMCLSCNDKKRVKVWDGRPVKVNSVDDLKTLLARGHNDTACTPV